MQDVHLLHPPYEVPLPGEILPPAPPNIHEEQINSPDGHRHVAVPADTQWNSVGGPVVDRVLDNDFVLAVPPTYILGEPSHVRIAYLQAIYNNVFNKMPVRATNDNLEATLQSLDAAGVLPTFPSPVKTLAGAKRRLGIDPDQSIISYAICPQCWKHYSPTQFSMLLSPSCTERGCTGVVYHEKTDTKGNVKRVPFSIDPQVSLIQRLRCIVRRKGFRRLVRDSRMAEPGRNNDESFIMTDMYDGDMWDEMLVKTERQRGEFGTIRDVNEGTEGGTRLSSQRFGLHLIINLDWSVFLTSHSFCFLTHVGLVRSPIGPTLQARSISRLLTFHENNVSSK